MCFLISKQKYTEEKNTFFRQKEYSLMSDVEKYKWNRKQS